MPNWCDNFLNMERRIKMPNWCDNFLNMEGIANLVKKNKKGEDIFDFNDVIPMPESLYMDSGSQNEYDIMYYLTDRLNKHYSEIDQDKKDIINKHITNNLSDDWHKEMWERCLENIKKMSDEEKDEWYARGHQLVDNIIKYGYPTWYGWRWEHWGCKWNASDTFVYDDDNIEFYTPWGPPEEVIQELSRAYKNRKVKCEWSEEGGYEGMIVALNGELLVNKEWTTPWEEEDEDL